MRGLLDVDVLVALFDVDHVFHIRAHEWLEANQALGIATCSLTENGLVRVLSHPNYSTSLRVAPAEMIRRLGIFCGTGDHCFWPDSVTLRDTDLFVGNKILGPKQISDVYLLGLAVNRNGRLVTFDEGVGIGTVRGARNEHLVVI